MFYVVSRVLLCGFLLLLRSMCICGIFLRYDPAGVNAASNHLVKYQHTLLKNRRFEESIKRCRNYTCTQL